MTAKSSLDVTNLTAALVRPGGMWRAVTVIPETGSTNADVLDLARQGAAEGLVLVAESQTAGRGRLGRRWVSAPGAGLAFSVLLDPRPVPARDRGWLPLLAGLAVACAVRATAAVDARLKWPNDVLVGSRKLAGVLVEGVGELAVVGVGVNVSQEAGQLPVPEATSVRLEATPPRAAPGRAEVLAGVLAEFAPRYLAWRDQPVPGDAGACGLRASYETACATLGREVTVTLPGGHALAGTASGVDGLGRLLVATARGVVPVTAGDVLHVR